MFDLFVTLRFIVFNKIILILFAQYFYLIFLHNIHCNHPKMHFTLRWNSFKKFSFSVILCSDQLVCESNKSSKYRGSKAKRTVLKIFFVWRRKSEKWAYSLLVSCFGWLPGDVAQLTFISWNIKKKERMRLILRNNVERHNFQEAYKNIDIYCVSKVNALNCFFPITHIIF